MRARYALPVAVHLFIVHEGQVLLLRRQYTGYEDGNYSVIAGHLNGGEELKTAMIREAREEAGITLGKDDLSVVGVMHRRAKENDRVDFFFTASLWSGDITNREPEKCDDLRWFPLNALPDNTIPYVRHALEAFLNGQWFDSYGWDSEP